MLEATKNMGIYSCLETQCLLKIMDSENIVLLFCKLQLTTPTIGILSFIRVTNSKFCLKFIIYDLILNPIYKFPIFSFDYFGLEKFMIVCV